MIDEDEIIKEEGRKLWAPQIKKMRDIQKKFPEDKDILHAWLDDYMLELLPEAIRDEYNKIKEEVGGFWYS